MGNTLHQMGDVESALVSYNKAVKINPDFAEAHYRIGGVINDQGDFDAAINSYKVAIKLKPDYAEAYIDMGNALNDQGNLEASIDIYKRAIKIKPNYAEAYYNMGLVLYSKGNLDSAIDSYKQALQIKPDNAEAYIDMGNAFKAKDDLQAAADSYRQALKIKPDFAQALSNLAQVLKLNLQYKEAKKCFDKLTDKESVGKGLECTYHLKNYGEFNEQLEVIAKKDPGNIRVAAISNFAAYSNRQKDSYPFCEKPIELIKLSHIKNHVADADKFINTILHEMNGKNASWEPKDKTTKSGYQTSGNLFAEPSAAMNTLGNIIRKELTLFYSAFKTRDSTLIENWPEEYSLQGWYVRMLQNGHQGSHIHPAGWVSGVFYLKTVEAPTENEGAIEFGVPGDDYPATNEDLPYQIYQPCNGDLILFPSSLFHKTIPVIKDVERCVIAFDLIIGGRGKNLVNLPSRISV
jgi:tetratricopeptide (TPR) repeat protein